MPGGGGGSGPLISGGPGGPGGGPFPRPNPSAMSMRVMMSDGPSCRPDALDAAAMSGGNGSAESMRLRTLVGSELPLGLTSFPKRSTRNRFVGGARLSLRERRKVHVPRIRADNRISTYAPKPIQ